MKSYTDLEQSKVLSKILSPESADMFLALNGILPVMSKYIDDGFVTADETAIPCWSLAALLDIIRNAIGYTLQTTYDKNPKVFIECELGDKPYSIESTEYDNEVDACYDMILQLKERDLL